MPFLKSTLPLNICFLIPLTHKEMPFVWFSLQEYFYGLSNDLSPHSNVANFSDLCIYRIGGGPQAPRSALPIGAEPAADPTRLTPVNINRDLLHSVLAVSFAKEPDEIISRYCLFKWANTSLFSISLVTTTH